MLDLSDRETRYILDDRLLVMLKRDRQPAGRRPEDVVAGTLRLALGRPDISPDRIRLRQRVVDMRGLVGPAGRRFEIGLLVDDGQITVFEVKSVCEAEHVDRLADKVALVRALHPGKKGGRRDGGAGGQR